MQERFWQRLDTDADDRSHVGHLSHPRDREDPQGTDRIPGRRRHRRPRPSGQDSEEPRLQVNNAALDGDGRGLRAILHSQFAEDMFDVVLGSLF